MPKIDINGTVREMTDEELSNMQIVDVEESEPTSEERIASLEAKNAELQTMIKELLEQKVESEETVT